MTRASEQQIQQKATNEVQSTYPDVLRADESLRNHAFAIAQSEVQQHQPTNKDPLAVQDYAEAYIAAYRHAVEERDARQ